MKATLMAAAAAMTAVPAGAASSDPAFDRAVEAVQSRMAPIDAMDGYIPGRALVFVKAGEKPIIDVRGVSHAERGTKVDENTPFYIASMTKAFVALMALELDRRGVMSLDMTLAEAYPDMKVEGVDLAEVTMRDALNHKLGFHAPALSLRTAYSDRLPVADYAKVVSALNEPTEAAFSYSNIGYILYAGALEKRTGRSWQHWLDEIVLGPLCMKHSSARTSDLPRTSFSHVRVGDQWRIHAPKKDDVMQAAGGMVVSGADMAKWLAANAGADSPIVRASFNLAHTRQAETSRESGPVKCTAYGFGWAHCEAGGIRFLEHGGTYTGARSEMIVLPDHGVGFAVMFNSESVTGGLGMQLFTAFVLAYAGKGDEFLPPDAFGARYAEMADKYRAHLADEEAQMDGGQFSPDAEVLLAASGTYEHPAFGTMELAAKKDALAGWLNGTAMVLKPMAPDHWAARLSTEGGGRDFKLVRDSGGAVVAITYGDHRFEWVKLAPAD